MKYTNVIKGIFLSRPNRFVAHVFIDGREEVCHVKNTGRLKELLLPGTEVYLEHAPSPGRKTAYDLIAVRKGDEIVNIDSQMPNQVVAEFLPKFIPDLTLLKREQKFGASRFDLYAESPHKKIFIEVKGVTLNDGGVARFPDAPTVRGIRHLEELCAAKEAGYESYVIFLIAMKGIHAFAPNTPIHQDFADALLRAKEKGVRILAFDAVVTADSVTVDKEIPVYIGENI